MNDNALKQLIRDSLLTRLAAQGLGSVLVVAANQPTSQGRTDTATVYFFPVTDARYGWQHRKLEYDQPNDEFTASESQWIESQFQLFALAPQDPENLALPTAKDLLNTVALIMNGAPFRRLLREQGVGVQRIAAIRAPYFTNDRQQFEESPSFDFTVSHKRTIIETDPVVDSTEFDQTRV